MSASSPTATGVPKQERHDIEEHHATLLSAQQEAERLAAIASELAPIIGPDGKRPKTDDGDLEIKQAPDLEKYNPDDAGALPEELGHIGGRGTDVTPETRTLVSR